MIEFLEEKQCRNAVVLSASPVCVSVSPNVVCGRFGGFCCGSVGAVGVSMCVSVSSSVVVRGLLVSGCQADVVGL